MKFHCNKQDQITVGPIGDYSNYHPRLIFSNFNASLRSDYVKSLKLRVVNEANLLGGENTGGETTAAPSDDGDDDGGDGDSDPARPPSVKEKASRIGTRKARKTEQKIIPDNSTLDLFGQESPATPAPTPAPTPCPASAVAAQEPPRAQLIPDLEEAKRFLDYLYDDSDARLSFQTFDDDKNRKSKHLANIYHGTLDQCAPRITDLQQQQAGVFLMVNGGDFKGRSAKNVTTVRCLFADTDGAPLAPLKSLKPHAIIESSPGNWHVYWRVSDCALAEFAPAQRAIAAKFGTDRSVCDLPRVLRLPGFYHQKSTPFQTRIVEISGHDPYPMKEIRAGLGIQNAPPYQPTPINAALPQEPINAALPQEPIYASPATVADLRSALCFLDSDDRTLWVAIGHALKTIGNLGKGLFFEWSQKSDKYDAGDIATEWRGFQPTQTNYKAVFKAAQDAGWVNPLSNAAGRGEAERAQSAQEVPQADLAALLAVLDESEQATAAKIQSALSAITPNSTLVGSKHTASKIVGLALCTEYGAAHRALGRALCAVWDATTAGCSLPVFETADPHYQGMTGALGIPTLFKLAAAAGWKFEGVKNDDDLGIEFSLKQFSLRGQTEIMMEKMLADKFILGKMAILGQVTVIYAEPNAGKTLLTLWLLRQAIVSGEIKGDDVFYINADDSYKGVITKNQLADIHGFHMLAPGHNDFDAQKLGAYLDRMAKDDTAHGKVIILDTLKKFTDIMHKKQSSEFLEKVRKFVSKGGSAVFLAHTNKHRSDAGKLIAAGTADVSQDVDCSYIADVIDSDSAGRRTVLFENQKNRGDVVAKVSFSYVRETGQNYQQILDSVVEISEIDAEKAKKEILVNALLTQNRTLIGEIIAAIEDGHSLRTDILAEVMARCGSSKAAVNRVLTQHTGAELPKGHRWNFTAGEKNAKLFFLLPFVSSGRKKENF